MRTVAWGLRCAAGLCLVLVVALAYILATVPDRPEALTVALLAPMFPLTLGACLLLDRARRREAYDRWRRNRSRHRLDGVPTQHEPGLR